MMTYLADMTQPIYGTPATYMWEQKSLSPIYGNENTICCGWGLYFPEIFDTTPLYVVFTYLGEYDLSMGHWMCVNTTYLWELCCISTTYLSFSCFSAGKTEIIERESYQ